MLGGKQTQLNMVLTIHFGRCRLLSEKMIQESRTKMLDFHRESVLAL